MTCKNCGTEIAANALLCYRCGLATEESGANRAPVKGSGRRAGGWGATLGAVVLVAAALFMGQSTFAQVPRGLSWTLAGLAVVVLIWRLMTRGRR